MCIRAHQHHGSVELIPRRRDPNIHALSRHMQQTTIPRWNKPDINGYAEGRGGGLAIIVFARATARLSVPYATNRA